MVRHHETDAPSRAPAAQAVAPRRGPVLPGEPDLRDGGVEVSRRSALQFRVRGEAKFLKTKGEIRMVSPISISHMHAEE